MKHLLGVMWLVLFAACGKTHTPALPQPVETATLKAQQSVTIWHAYVGDEAKAMDALVAQWNKLQPEVHMAALAVPADTLFSKFQTDVAAGHGPDLVVVQNDKLGPWLQNDLLQPLGDFATPQRLGRFLPQTVQPLGNDRGLWGLPLAFRTAALFYNRKLVAIPPKTLGQLIEVAKGFTPDPAKPVGLVYDAADPSFHAAFLQAMGGQVWDAHAKAVTIDTPEAIQAAELVRALHTEQRILPQVTGDAAVAALFNGGKVPFAIQRIGFIGAIGPAIDWGVAVLPELTPGKPLRPELEVDALVLTRSSRGREAALRIVDYLTSDEAAITRMAMGGQMVANLKTYENPRWLEKPVVRVFHAQAATSVALPLAPEASVASAPYGQALQEIFFAGADPKTALVKAQAAADQALARLGK